MGILSGIVKGLTSIGHAVITGLAWVLGIKVKKKPPKEWLRAELRKQWLAIPKDARQEIPGVEYEGELYYETEQ